MSWNNYLKHCKTAFMKHVFPWFCKPTTPGTRSGGHACRLSGGTRPFVLVVVCLTCQCRKKYENCTIRIETYRGRERVTEIENVLIKWINTSIYWIIIIGLIHFCCFHSLFSRLKPLACVQIVTFQISVFFLSNCNARILCWFTLKCQQNSIKETLIFGLFPRNFIGASSFKKIWAKAEAGKKQLDNHIFRSYWNAQCEPITQIHSNFGKCWTYTNKRIRKISSSFCSLNHMKRNRQNECFFPRSICLLCCDGVIKRMLEIIPRPHQSIVYEYFRRNLISLNR